MKKKYASGKLLEILSKTPFVSYAIAQVGISRTTFYRWIKSNPEFKEAVEKALADGREQVTDMAEMKLLQLIKEGNFKAIQFYLQHNSSRYYNKRLVEVPALPHKLKPGETCLACEYTQPKSFGSVKEGVEFVKDLAQSLIELEQQFTDNGMNFYDELESNPELRKKTKIFG